MSGESIVCLHWVLLSRISLPLAINLHLMEYSLLSTTSITSTLPVLDRDLFIVQDGRYRLESLVLRHAET